jgi:hypothetical protein
MSPPDCSHQVQEDGRFCGISACKQLGALRFPSRCLHVPHQQQAWIWVAVRHGLDSDVRGLKW